MIVTVDGVRYDVPDDSTPEEIDAISRKTSVGEALKRGAVQGLTLRMGDEIAGMARAGLTQPSAPRTTPGPKALAAMYPGLPYPDAAARWFAENRPDVAGANAAETARQGQQSNYELQRDAIRQANARAKQDRPWAYGGAELAGGAAPAILLTPQTTGATLLGRMASGAKAAAPVGAAFGYGGSEAPTLGGQMYDTFVGGAGAAGAGALLPALGAAVSPVAQRVSQGLRTRAIEQGRKALSGIGTPLSARKEVPADVVEQAIRTGAIQPFGTVTGTAKRLATQADDIGQQYADILDALAKAGVQGPEAQRLAAEFASRAASARTTSILSPRPGMLEKAAEEVTALPTAQSGRLGLLQAEEIKRGLQNEAKREYDKITRQYTTTGETKKELAAVVRQAIEDAVQQQSSLAPAEAAAFEPVKAGLSRTLGALRVAEEGAARAARRKPVSLTSTIVGSAAGAASGSPSLGVGTALLHGVMDARLASALARAYYGGSKALSTGARTAAVSRGTAPVIGEEWARLLAESLGRPRFVAVPAGEEGP